MKEQNDNRICLGSRVLVQFEDGDRLEFTINARDVDLAAGIISAMAPLAQSLLGAREGDHVTYLAHQVRQSVKILRVAPAEVHDAAHRHAVPA